ncbi:MAG: Holliday junction branch migration protein RuvA [Polyangia bacterium]
MPTAAGGGIVESMIGSLRGKISDKSSNGAVIDVGGVGYDVSLPLGTLAALPPVGREISLWIHTHVREEELRLFGFNSRSDRAAFRTMLKVGGVGPRVALAVLGALTGGDLARVVESADTRRLTAIPGIGKKTAERIVLELGGKLELGGESVASQAGGVLAELRAALVNLGFKPGHVDRTIGELGDDSGERPFEDLLRQSLGLLRD